MPRSTRSKWLFSGCVLAAGAVLGTLSLLAIGLGTGLSGFVTGFVMAVVPVPFYIAMALTIDRFEPEPPWLLATAFVWGATIAIFFALVVNTVNEGLLSLVAGANAASTLGSILSAPFVEELTKGAALLLLFLWRRDYFDDVTDGIVYATMVGLGFAMTENVQYYGRAVTMPQEGSAAVVFFMRGIMGPFAHPLYTSATGIGFGAARESDRTWVKWLAPPLGLGAAMLLHGIWNLSASFGLVFFAAYVVIMMPAALAVLVIALFSLRREANIIRAHLEKVVSEGVLSHDDVLVVTSVRRRIGESTRALLEGGVRKWRARRRFHALASELAFHSWRSSRAAGPDAFEIRMKLVEAVRNARARLGLPQEVRQPEPQLVARLTREMPLPVTPELAREQNATLICTAGPLAGQSFLIGYTGVQIGRDPASSEVVVRDQRVSKRHVWIGHGADGVVAIDRGSTNGTRVNGALVSRATLRSGDRVEIGAGAATFELHVSPAT
ncbi:MAG TPA: PrsW family glutamic-type intramembrane protease [Thermoanaerobaculia bacterium]|jgi:RsiW-degrading membrane proteinase PrsW (M82 family)